MEGNIMLLLSKEDIMKVFTMKNSIEAVENAFKSFSEGKTDVPLRTQIQAPAHDGVFVFMPAYCAQIDAASLKVVDVFPHNIDNGIPSIPAQVILIDGKTGVASALLDGTYVTQMRTGAASGAAFDLLAKRDCVKGALIGTGGQAPAQLEAMLTARKLKEVRVFDINLERCRAFVAQMNEELKSYGTKIIPASSSDEAIAKADLIITVTLSDTPVFDGTKIKAGELSAVLVPINPTCRSLILLFCPAQQGCIAIPWMRSWLNPVT
jgi:ornithine cyclodeaminase